MRHGSWGCVREIVVYYTFWISVCLAAYYQQHGVCIRTLLLAMSMIVKTVLVISPTLSDAFLPCLTTTKPGLLLRPFAATSDIPKITKTTFRPLPT